MSTESSQGKNPYTPLIIAVGCLVLWTAGTFGYVTWAISQSQHKWCTTIELLSNAPAPVGHAGNPVYDYESKLAQDIMALKHELGC